MNYLDATILIVDDKVANISILEDLLRMQGYNNIYNTTDSRTVLELYHTLNPDILLLDLMMPFLSGYEVMDQLKLVIPKGAYFPILVLTADISRDVKLRVLAAGATDFLSKPFDLIEVGLRIKNMIFTRSLYLKLESQNLNLESKVRERTKELEENNKELIISKEKAQASDRLKTAFLNNISHEIRTPLAGILGFASLIITPEITQNEKEEYYTVLKQNSERLTNTVNDYMDISLITSGNLVANFELVDIFFILQTLNNDFYEQCNNKDLKLKLQYIANPIGLKLETDKELLIKALSKIIDNAIKFTPKGSVTIGFDLKDDQAIFIIKDTGIGVDFQAQKQMLEIFMQENNSITRRYEGSGLGLSITSGLIKLLKGTIHFDFDNIAGTSFFVTLPILADN